MNEINFVFDAANTRLANPFNKIFFDQFSTSTEVEIVVGYISERSISYLSELLDEFSNVNLSLTCGMQGREGMTSAQQKAVRKLDKKLSSSGRGGVYVTPRLPYHGKIYFFINSDGCAAYVGSANLSSIKPGYTSTYEAGVFFKNAPFEMRKHLERDIFPLRVSVLDAEIPVISSPTSPMQNVKEASAVETSLVAAIMASPARYTFYLPLKTFNKSSLNAHMARARNADSNYSAVRDWYEGELIVGKEIRDQPGYPKKNEEFDVVTDDGWRFTCKIGGDFGKNLRSRGKLSTFGTWMKSRLVEAGALEIGELAGPEHLVRYGRNYLTMRYHPTYNTWTFDLSVTDQTTMEPPTNG